MLQRPLQGKEGRGSSDLECSSNVALEFGLNKEHGQQLNSAKDRDWRMENGDHMQMEKNSKLKVHNVNHQRCQKAEKDTRKGKIKQ